jgi:DNA-binding NtrC family response regulator
MINIHDNVTSENTKQFLVLGQPPAGWLSDLKIALKQHSVRVDVYKNDTRRCDEQKYDLVLLCNQTQNQTMQFLQDFKRRSCPVVVTSNHPDWRLCRDVLKAGALECICQTEPIWHTMHRLKALAKQ